MKIYSDKITREHVETAFSRARMDGADIWIESIRTWNPRAYGYGTEVHGYSMNGKRWTNNGSRHWAGEHFHRAASWTDWGYAIAYLYKLDPDARVGIYQNQADFIATVCRWPRAGESLAFLKVLLDTNEYMALTHKEE